MGIICNYKFLATIWGLANLFQLKIWNGWKIRDKFWASFASCKSWENFSKVSLGYATQTETQTKMWIQCSHLLRSWQALNIDLCIIKINLCQSYQHHIWSACCKLRFINSLHLTRKATELKEFTPKSIFFKKDSSCYGYPNDPSVACYNNLSGSLQMYTIKHFEHIFPLSFQWGLELEEEGEMAEVNINFPISEVKDPTHFLWAVRTMFKEIPSIVITGGIWLINSLKRTWQLDR